ncbi:hypothetical protein PSPO01_07180 [Paraphaeosphaeria sporulosa]
MTRSSLNADTLPPPTPPYQSLHPTISPTVLGYARENFVT